jgi:hypothetical protein
MTAFQAGAKVIEVMMASMSVASAGVATATSCEWQAEVLAVRWSGTEESPRRYFVEVLPRINVCGFFLAGSGADGEGGFISGGVVEDAA